MAIFQLSQKRIEPINESSFSELGIQERGDMQRLLRDQIEIIAPDVLVIDEEFGHWDESRRRIDLLAIDKDANLVVIELKRTEDGGHMELQALRYAAMISTMSFDQAVESFERYLRHRKDDRDAKSTILRFLEWESPDEDDFGNDVRIILVAADFSKELTTSVLWLLDRQLDIRCIRIKPYGSKEQILLDVQQVIPLPEAEEYQIRVREKKTREREQRQSKNWQPKSADEIWELFEKGYNSVELDLAREICEWIEPKVTDHFPTKDGFANQLTIGKTQHYFFKLRKDARIGLWFQYWTRNPPFNDQAVQMELLDRLNKLPEVELNIDQIRKRPSFPISILQDPAAMSHFKQTIEWAIELANTNDENTQEE